VCPFLKGAKVQDELTTAERDWAMTVGRVPGQTSADGVVPWIAGPRAR
jgi:hypothetical protein